MRHVLVTGAAGFIGSHLVEDLLRDGSRVTAVDNFDSYYPRQLKEENLRTAQAHPRFRLLEADIRDFAGLCTRLPDTYDCVVHLAAKVGVRPSIEDTRTYQEVNVTGTQNMLDFARLRAIPQFVFASSSSVYGTNPNVPWREEDSSLKPISPYAATKAAGELLGHVYSHLYGIRFVALRLFTVYGPRQRPDLAINKFAQLMLLRQAIPMFGDGLTRRDYTFVNDVIAAMRKAMDYRDSIYEAINVGGGHPVTLRELIHAMEQALGTKAVLALKPEQAGDVSQTFADGSKAAQLLAFRCQTSITEGLQEFTRWRLQTSLAEAPLDELVRVA